MSWKQIFVVFAAGVAFAVFEGFNGLLSIPFVEVSLVHKDFFTRLLALRFMLVLIAVRRRCVIKLQ